MRKEHMQHQQQLFCQVAQPTTSHKRKQTEPLPSTKRTKLINESVQQLRIKTSKRKRTEPETEAKQGNTVTVKYKEGDFKGKSVKRMKKTDKFLIRWTEDGTQSSVTLKPESRNKPAAEDGWELSAM